MVFCSFGPTISAMEVRQQWKRENYTGCITWFHTFTTVTSLIPVQLGSDSRTDNIFFFKFLKQEFLDSMHFSKQSLHFLNILIFSILKQTNKIHKIIVLNTLFNL